MVGADSAESGEDAVSEKDPEQPDSEAETGGNGTALGTPLNDPEASGSDGVEPADGPSVGYINEDVVLTTVAQAESTRSFFLAQTLESTKTVPVVSAKLPIEGEGTDEVVGSFTYRGITYAVEPGGESVAVVAADYSKLPSDFIEAQAIVLSSVVSPDGIVSYSVTRIAQGAFSNLAFTATEGNEGSSVMQAQDGAREHDDDPGSDAADRSGTDTANVSDGSDASSASTADTADQGVSEASGFDEGSSNATSDVRADGAAGAFAPFDNADIAANETTSEGGPFTGIIAVTVPASVTAIEDDAFAGFETLQYVIVSSDNPEYSMYDGCLYDKSLTRLLLIPGGRLGAVRVAPSAVTIPEDVVSHCAYVTSLIADPASAAFAALEDVEICNANGDLVAIGSPDDGPLVDTDAFLLNEMEELAERLACGPESAAGEVRTTSDVSVEDPSLAVADDVRAADAAALSSKAAPNAGFDETVNGFTYTEPTYLEINPIDGLGGYVMWTNRFTGSVSWTEPDWDDASLPYKGMTDAQRAAKKAEVKSTPIEGSLVTVDVQTYVPGQDNLLTEEAIRSKYSGTKSWRDGRQLVGIRNIETGCYVSLETMYSGNPFTLSYYMKTPTPAQETGEPSDYGMTHSGNYVDKELGICWFGTTCTVDGVTYNVPAPTFECVFDQLDGDVGVRFYPGPYGSKPDDGTVGVISSTIDATLNSGSPYVNPGYNRGNNSVNLLVVSKSVKDAAGKEVGVLRTPQTLLTNGNKVFLGWFTRAGVKVTSLAELPDDRFLYAHWADAAGETITYDTPTYLELGSKGNMGGYLMWSNRFTGSVSWTEPDWSDPGLPYKSMTDAQRNAKKTEVKTTPIEGSLVTVDVQTYVPTQDNLLTLETIRAKLRGSNWMSGEQLIGIRNIETGCFVTLDTIYSGHPFSFSYYMKAFSPSLSEGEPGDYGMAHSGNYVDRTLGICWFGLTKTVDGVTRSVPDSTFDLVYDRSDGDTGVCFYPGPYGAKPEDGTIGVISSAIDTSLNSGSSLVNPGYLRTIGNVRMIVSSTSVKDPSGSETGLLQTPQSHLTNGDKVFLGWFTRAGVRVTSLAEVPSDRELYAHWADPVGEPIRFTVPSYLELDAKDRMGGYFLWTNRFTGNVSWTEPDWSDAALPYKSMTEAQRNAKRTEVKSTPIEGSLVIVDVQTYVPAQDNILTIEALKGKFKGDDWQTGDSLVGIRNTETGCYVSAETIYSGNPFTLSFYMKKPTVPQAVTEPSDYGVVHNGHYVDKEVGIGWSGVNYEANGVPQTTPNSTFECVFDRVEDEVGTLFFPGPAGANPASGEVGVISSEIDPTLNSGSSFVNPGHNRGNAVCMLVMSKSVKDALGNETGILQTPQTHLTNGDKVFLGWFTAAGTKVTSLADIPSSHMLYAHWTDAVATRYGILYDGNGADDGVTAGTFNYQGLPVTVAENGFARTGHHFTGWKKEDGTPYSPGATFAEPVLAGERVTLYAQWAPNTYGIEYMWNCVDESGEDRGLYSRDEKPYDRQSLTPAPSRTGYTLLGWSLDPDATEKTWDASAQVDVKDLVEGRESTSTEDEVGSAPVYAIWSLDDYLIRIDAKAGGFDETAIQILDGASLSPDGKVLTIPFTYESKSFAFPVDAVQAAVGWKFGGWKLVKRAGVEVSSDAVAMVTVASGSVDDREYEVVYVSESDYTISYDIGQDLVPAGTWGDYDTSLYSAPATYNVETETFTLPTPVRNGYVFRGWTGGNDASKECVSTDGMTVAVVQNSVTGPLSFTAEWKPCLYALTLKSEVPSIGFSAAFIIGDETQDIDGDGIPDSLQGDGFTFTTDPSKEDHVVKDSDDVPVETVLSADGTTITVPFTFESSDVMLPTGLKLKGGWVLSGWKNGEGGMVDRLASGSFGSRAYTISWTPIYSIDLPVGEGAYGSENAATLYIDAVTGKTGTSLGGDANKVTSITIRSATPVDSAITARSLAPQESVMLPNGTMATQENDDYAKAFFYEMSAGKLDELIRSMKFEFLVNGGVRERSLPSGNSKAVLRFDRRGTDSTSNALTVIARSDNESHVDVVGVLDMTMNTELVNDGVGIWDSSSTAGKAAIEAALDAIGDPLLKRLTTIVWTVDAIE